MGNTNQESPTATDFRASVHYWQVQMQKEVSHGIAGGMGMHEYIHQIGGSWPCPGDLFPLQVCAKALDERDGRVVINEAAMESIVWAFDAEHQMGIEHAKWMEMKFPPTEADYTPQELERIKMKVGF